MKVVIQRVSEASVTIENKLKATIGQGYLILLGIGVADTQNDIDWLTNKIIGLRIFNDTVGAMNLSIQDIKGDILVISQFTLFASTKKGNRPSFITAARPELAIPLYENFLQSLSQKLNQPIHSGEFGANMKVALINDGPVTIAIDTKEKR